MEEILDIAKYILPSLVVFAASFYIIKTFLTEDHKKRVLEVRLGNQKIITPIKLQAYERIALFLERIALNNLIVRVYKPGMSARMLQSELLKAIRAEFEHNLSQQIYISNDAWNAVKTAKEETIKAINIASSKVSDEASGTDLSKIIFELITKVDKLPSEYALELIKMEIRQSF
jgi:hypothetical protein